jgi:hypothetical protein
MALQLPPPPNNPVSNSFEWREWFYKLYTKTTSASGISFNSLDFSDSNIESIVTRDHDTLTNIQGGDSLNRYHLTQSQYNQVATLPTFGTIVTQNLGLSATITTAALTPTGTTGSMTFVNGILTAQTQAT